MEEEKTKNAIRGSFSNIAPNQRFCYKCGQIIFHKIYVKLQLYFYCFSCNTSTFWAEGSIFSSKCISLSTLENLLHLYLRNKSKQETIDDMKFTYGIQIAKMTVSKYFALFDQVILKYYEECHKKKILSGHIEIDETKLYKQKVSNARARPYSYGRAFAESPWPFVFRRFYRELYNSPEK